MLGDKWDSPPRILFPEKGSFKIKSEIEIFPDNGVIEFIASKKDILEILKKTCCLGKKNYIRWQLEAKGRKKKSHENGKCVG